MYLFKRAVSHLKNKEMKFPWKDLIWADMHNIARNCNLQLLDGVVYLEGKEKEERQEGNRSHSVCML